MKTQKIIFLKDLAFGSFQFSAGQSAIFILTPDLWLMFQECRITSLAHFVNLFIDNGHYAKFADVA